MADPTDRILHDHYRVDRQAKNSGAWQPQCEAAEEKTNNDAPPMSRDAGGVGTRNMSNTPFRSRSWTVAVSVLMVTATALISRSVSVNRELRAVFEIQSLVAARTTTHDRLIGTRVPSHFWRQLAQQAEVATDKGARLLWIVDTDRCERCLADGLGAWNALANDSTLVRQLVAVGDAPVPEEAKRALRGTPATVMTREDLQTTFGNLLPNTKMLIDGKGIILLADSRNTGSECGWSFDAQVGAIRGSLASELVRNQP